MKVCMLYIRCIVCVYTLDVIINRSTLYEVNIIYTNKIENIYSYTI